MTDNVVEFKKREKKIAEKKSNNVVALGTICQSHIDARVLDLVIRDLKVMRPDLYFDSHLIFNDRLIKMHLSSLVARMLELGTDPNPGPSKPITDHKG